MVDYIEHKRLLNEEKDLLLSELKKIGAVKSTSGIKDDYEAKSIDVENDVEDNVDTAKNINDLRRNEAIISELEKRLQYVDRAIERIDKNEYGFCSVCKKPIEEKRLAVNPAADTCMEHMEV